MREKLLELMKSEGLKSSQLAEMLGINPAAISHLLAGRNKPGFDLLQKILRRFPQINPDWLLLDSDQMFRENYAPVSEAHPKMKNELFEQMLTPQLPVEKPERPTEDRVSSAPNSFTDTKSLTAEKSATSRIERIVVFYCDQTFEDFRPKK